MMAGMAASLLIFLIHWQQSVDYTIDAYLDTEVRILAASERITYRNNSPDTLDTLYFHLYANAFDSEQTTLARDLLAMGQTVVADMGEGERGGIDIGYLRTGDDTLDIAVDETIMSVPLRSALRPDDSLSLEIEYRLRIPKYVLRMGYWRDHYEMTQWFPALCVYDEAGWHTDQYRGIGEFYGEFGSFDVTLDVPRDFVVAATGMRVDSLDLAFTSALAADNTRIMTGARRRVAFIAEDVHDFAWVADPHFLVEKHDCDDIDIYIYYREENKKKWRHAGSYAVEAVRRYNQWFGPYPYQVLHVVDGEFEGGMEYPQLVTIGYGEDRFTRIFESIIAHEIGHQWFYGTLGTDEINEAWLDEGLTSYAEVRYLEDRYGRNHSLLRIPFFSVSRRYTHRLVYYIIQSNGLERPILTRPSDFVDIPLSYVNSAYSKPTLFLLFLESFLGQETLATVLRRFCSEWQFKHPHTRDFIEICEEESGMELDPLFQTALTTTAFSDWDIVSIDDGIIQIRNHGDLILPVDVMVKTTGKDYRFALNGEEKTQTITLPDTAGEIKSVSIDPTGITFEPNHWNNHYPRRIKVQPLLSQPSLDATMIWFTPYLWYGKYDGLTLGFYMAGSDFIDYDFLKGENLWLFGGNYGLRSKNLYPTFSYQTPILFRRGVRIRIALQAAQGNGEDVVTGGFTGDIGIPFARSPALRVSTMLVHNRLFSHESVDSMDWELGRSVGLDNTVTLIKKPWSVSLRFVSAHTIIGSNWNYLKTSCEIKRDFHLPIPWAMRIFIGRTIGDPPQQELFYLSGALRITFIPDLFGGSQKGYFSPQEHLHIAGDGNMRGYQSLHLNSDALYTMNLVIPRTTPLRIFTDIGYCDRFVYDIGAQIVIGPVSVNIPFYIFSDEPWRLRWSIGL